MYSTLCYELYPPPRPGPLGLKTASSCLKPIPWWGSLISKLLLGCSFCALYPWNDGWSLSVTAKMNIDTFCYKILDTWYGSKWLDQLRLFIERLDLDRFLLLLPPEKNGLILLKRFYKWCMKRQITAGKAARISRLPGDFPVFRLYL